MKSRSGQLLVVVYLSALLGGQPAITACSGDGCAGAPTLEEWRAEVVPIWCEYTWKCEDGQSGEPPTEWLDQCTEALTRSLDVNSITCYDRCRADSSLQIARGRLASCSTTGHLWDEVDEFPLVACEADSDAP